MLRLIFSINGWLCRVFCVLLMGALSLGCSSKEILREQSLVAEQSLSSLTAAKQVKIEGGLPQAQRFHVAVRVSETFLNRAATELLKAEVVPSTFEQPLEFNVPPIGPKVVLRPGISVSNPKLTFSGECGECFHLESRFVGTLALDVGGGSSAAAKRWFEGAALSGQVLLRARLIPMYVGGIASLGIEIKKPRAGDIKITTKVPLPGVDTLLADALVDQIGAALSNPRYSAFPMLPLKALGVPGSKMAVTGIRFTLRTTPERDLFVGVLLNLKTPPEIDPASSRPLKNADFQVEVGQNTLTQALRIWMAEDLIPAGYDTDGNESKKGPLFVELKSLRLEEERYVAETRIWHTGTPPFWRDYRMSGGLGVRSDAVVIQNSAAELVAKKGPNRLVDAVLLLEKVSVKGTLEGIGSRFPRQLAFPFGEPTRLTATVEVQELQTEKQRAAVWGAVVFTPTASPGGKRAPPSQLETMEPLREGTRVP